ncbi:hypothetical protein COO91_07978 [Nostoc flagelliforme CCNUN1]|uniref:Uncharacterized protein n=1 Tax=Nostoc flagelliforme CCNUN1 TaxID=2038116 RepID=A0A2K8T2Q3_9NOSO|nr:hypothetical protein COO91_07978 [Nostoc flagelliforme CCNUN1]
MIPREMEFSVVLATFSWLCWLQLPNKYAIEKPPRLDVATFRKRRRLIIAV